MIIRTKEISFRKVNGNSQRSSVINVCKYCRQISVSRHCGLQISCQIVSSCNQRLQIWFAKVRLPSLRCATIDPKMWHSVIKSCTYSCQATKVCKDDSQIFHPGTKVCKLSSPNVHLASPNFATRIPKRYPSVTNTCYY